MVFQYGDFDGTRIQLGAAHHQHGGDRMRDQMLALFAAQAVLRIGPRGVHIEHAHIVQQCRSGQRHAFALGPAILEGQENRHQRHLQAVVIKILALLAHDSEFEGDGLGQQQALERCQQALQITHGLDHADQQLDLLALLSCQGHQRSHIDQVTRDQVGINRVTQLVHDQTVIETAVHTCTFVHQLHALLGIDCVTCHHLRMLGHIGDRAQKMYIGLVP